MSSEETIFAEAMGIESPEARSAYLERACGGDGALREQVNGLLAAHERAAGFMQSPAHAFGATSPVDESAASPTSAHEREPVGATIGPYKILERLGEGGMGVVYMADQLSPIRRKVALKIIKPGMDSRQVIARFEAERQALAMMDHPGIARVLDAGTTDSGRPYFAMELVKGVPITEYCDANHLTPRERLGLFMQVCRAVQHAHTKGIVHRDLKPTNILVTLHDGLPVPKVIDFGIAKATGGAAEQLTDKTLFTRFAQMLGTPLYMSPEQAEFSGLDVDTRSDVYSLGVLLYELLTGTTPFDKLRLGEAALDEVRRIIREEEPPRPSTRLSTLGAQLTAISARRRTDPGKLGPSMRGELDWIVMRSLEKDRARRYETVSAFAADVQRHLDNRPVEACPPSALYRLRKFSGRNKRTMVSGALIAAALTAGTVVSTWQAVRVHHEQRRTLAQKLEADRQRDAALEEKRRADEQATIADAVVHFLRYDVLAQADPRQHDATTAAPNPNLTVREALDRAAARLSDAFDFRPKLDVAIRVTIGQAYEGIGEYEEAARHLEAAVDRARQPGVDGRRKWEALSELAWVYGELGRLTEAESLALEAMEIRRREVGDDHPDVFDSTNRLGVIYTRLERFEEAERAFKLSLAGRRSATMQRAEDSENEPENAYETQPVVHNLANLYQRLQRLPEAAKLLEESLPLCRERYGALHPYTLATLNDLAVIYDDQGRYAAAEPLFVQALEGRRKALGDRHPHTLNSIHNVGFVLSRQDRFKEAEPLFVEALQGRRDVLGAAHLKTLNSLRELGQTYARLDRFVEAEPLLEAALAGFRKVQGNDGADAIRALELLAILYKRQGNYVDAEPLYLQLLELASKSLGESHPGVLETVGSLGKICIAQGRLDEAEGYYMRALDVQRKAVGENHLNSLMLMNDLAVVYGAQGRQEESGRLLKQAWDGARKTLGDEHRRTLNFMANVGASYEKQDRLEEAETILAEALAGQRKVMGEEHLDTRRTLYNLALVIRDRRRDPARAVEHFQALLASETAANGPDSTETARALRELAKTLRLAARDAEAEPVFRRALAFPAATWRHPAHRADILHNLAEILTDSKRFAEAEPLWLELLNWLEARPSGETDGPSTAVVNGQVVAFYKAWGRPAPPPPREPATQQQGS